MRLNKISKCAIQILVHCAKAEGNLVLGRELALRLDTGQHNILKITRLLSKAGFADTIKGRQGGMRLAAPPDHIRLGDVVRYFEAITLQVDADGEIAAAHESSAAMNELLAEAAHAFMQVLDAHTLSDIVTSRGPAIAASKPPKTKRLAVRPSRTARP